VKKEKSTFLFSLGFKSNRIYIDTWLRNKILPLCLSAFYPFFDKYIFMETKEKQRGKSKIEFSDMDLNVVSQTARMIHKDSRGEIEERRIFIHVRQGLEKVTVH
jgi:hypothetical protein